MIEDRKDFMKIDYEREKLDQEQIKKLLKEIHELRNKKGLMNKPDDYVIIQALKMYVRQKKRTLRNKLNLLVLKNE